MRKDINPYKITQLRKTMTNQQIARLYNIAPSTFSQWCKRNNVITARITDWEVAEEIGTKTVKEIAYEYNVSASLLYNRLSKLGICARQPGQKR